MTGVFSVDSRPIKEIVPCKIKPVRFVTSVSIIVYGDDDEGDIELAIHEIQEDGRVITREPHLHELLNIVYNIDRMENKR